VIVLNVGATSAVSTLAVSTSRAGSPGTNLQLDSQQVRWQAATDGTTSAYVEIVLAKAATSLVLVGTTADAAALTVGGAVPAGLVATEYIDPYFGWSTWWFTFDSLASGTTVRVTLTKVSSAGSALGASRLLVGDVVDLSESVIYPLQEGLRDTSIITELASGNFHCRNRPRARTYAGQARLSRTAGMISMLRDMGRTLGSQATAFHVAPEWGAGFCVYARMLTLPSGGYDWPNYGLASFELVEVL